MSLDSSSFEVLVVGGGPAGYAAALRAAQIGARTALIEKHKLGGACLNYACIPTKYLRYTVEILHNIDKAARYGISADVKPVDWPAIQSTRQNLIDGQREGVRGLLSTSGVHIIYGEASRLAGHTVFVSPNRESGYSARRIILATGSSPARLNIPGAGLVLSSRELLTIEKLPHTLAIIGGGPVGIELATIFSGFGVMVSVIEMLPHILPGEDTELTIVLERELRTRGVRLFTGCKVQRVQKNPDNLGLVIAVQDKEEIIEVDQAALCVGQKPTLGEMDTSGSVLTLDHGALNVDEHLFTGQDGVYAAGDVTGKALLAYVATMQGRVAAESALGIASSVDYEAIPHCVFSKPELASIGLTEESARSAGRSVSVGHSPFSANAAATIQSERRGMVKVVIDSGTNRLLGVHILGLEAPIIIHEAALALKTGALVTDIQRTLHAHPNLSEALWEAALDATSENLHSKNNKGVY